MIDDAHDIFKYLSSIRELMKAAGKMGGSKFKIIHECFFTFLLTRRLYLLYSPPFLISGRNSVVECYLAKVDVDGSNPFARSIFFHGGIAKWLRQRSAKPLFSGSNPDAASRLIQEFTFRRKTPFLFMIPIIFKFFGRHMFLGIKPKKAKKSLQMQFQSCK
jgi:hypothetical protein